VGPACSSLAQDLYGSEMHESGICTSPSPGPWRARRLDSTVWTLVFGWPQLGLSRLCGSLHGLDTFWARGLSWINNETTTTTTTFNHLYQACSSSGLREVPVDTFQLSGARKICISFGNLEDENGKTESWRNTYRGVDLKKMRFVPEGFSCTNSITSCTWRKVVDGYKRNIVSLPKHHFELVVSLQPWCESCDPLFETQSATHWFLQQTHCFLQQLQFNQNPAD